MKLLVGALFVVLLIGSVHATAVPQYSLHFDVRKDASALETISIDFGAPITTVKTYSFDIMPQSIGVSDQNGPVNFALTGQGPYLLTITPRNTTTELVIQFRTSDLIFESGGKYLFFTTFSSPLSIQNLSVALTLPEDYGFVPGSFDPQAQTTTDGRRITAAWALTNFTGNMDFSAKYESLTQDLTIPVAFGILLVAAIVLLYYRRGSHEKLLKGFSEDEKKVITHLMRTKTDMQNNIEKEYKFSRAKMTRITAKLVAKQMITKQKKGRTNRLTWKK